MRITLAIGLDGTRINDFLEGGSLGRLWKMSGDDGEVDEMPVCRFIMVRTNSSYLVQLGLTQQKRRLTGFQYSFLYLPSTPVDDTGKVSSPVSYPQNTILTPLIAGTATPSTTNLPYPSSRPDSKPSQAATY